MLKSEFVTPIEPFLTAKLHVVFNPSLIESIAWISPLPDQGSVLTDFRSNGIDLQVHQKRWSQLRRDNLRIVPILPGQAERKWRRAYGRRTRRKCNSLRC